MTREGVWGRWIPYTTTELVKAINKSKQEVFHLMGGAPALQMDNWVDIIEMLPEKTTFHSDLMLTERNYKMETLKKINQENCLYAVGIKGLTLDEFHRNTRKTFDMERFWRNLELVKEAGLKIYFTFTNVDKLSAEKFMSYLPEYESFHIDLIDYEAMTNVDDVFWGKAEPVEV